MSRFEIVIESDDTSAREWGAAIFAIDYDGDSGDMIESGYGDTPMQAVKELVGKLPEGWKGGLCSECGGLIDTADVHAGHGMCASCLHDAIRSGWDPSEGEEES